jgi:IS5 family transposase
MRDVERKIDDAAFQKHKGTLILSELILTQKRTTRGKVYSLHAPEVECIAKGKAHKPYEFGVKASLAVTHKEGFVVGAMNCPENPYDGHTLEGQFDQVERLQARCQPPPSWTRDTRATAWPLGAAQSSSAAPKAQ